MKIIFLDIDGVLVTERHLHYLHDNNSPLGDSRGRHLFDPKCVHNLTRLIEGTGAQIVISSTWKIYGLKEMQQLWIDREIAGAIIDVTPNLSGMRGAEIGAWLKGNLRARTPQLRNFKIDNYVIIDDEKSDLLIGQAGHLVQTTWKQGLEEAHVEQAIAILDKPSY